MKRGRILITGGTGFLGVHLARKLLRRGYKIVLFDIASLDAEDLFGKVSVIQADVRDRKAIEKALENQDFVVHAASALPIQRFRKAIFSVNLDGTRNVLEGSLKQKIKRVIFISTTAVYGVPKELPEKEESTLSPIGYYGESKLKAENLCKAFTKKGLSINILRPKTFLGPERLGVFQLWFEAIYTGKQVFILGSGNNRYQLLAVSDVVDAIIESLESKIDGEIFNIGAEKFGSWRNDLGRVISYAQSKSRVTSIPILPAQAILNVLEKLQLSPIAAWHYKTLPVDSYVSIEKAKKLLNFRPKKSNEDLLLENYKWYENHRDTIINKVGITHRVGWNFGILNIVRRFL